MRSESALDRTRLTCSRYPSFLPPPGSRITRLVLRIPLAGAFTALIEKHRRRKAAPSRFNLPRLILSLRLAGSQATANSRAETRAGSSAPLITVIFRPSQIPASARLICGICVLP